MVKIAIFPFRFGLWAGLESGSWIFEPLTLLTAVQVTWFEGLGDEGAIEWNTEKCIRKERSPQPAFLSGWLEACARGMIYDRCQGRIFG